MKKNTRSDVDRVLVAGERVITFVTVFLHLASMMPQKTISMPV